MIIVIYACDNPECKRRGEGTPKEIPPEWYDVERDGVVFHYCSRKCRDDDSMQKELNER